MSDGFQRVLGHIRSIADTEAEKGRLFERLMKAYFEQDPHYRDRFSNVGLWSEWAAARRGFDGADTGIDLVAEERGGGFCAIQCKCYAPGTRISKADLDSFIAASARRRCGSRTTTERSFPSTIIFGLLESRRRPTSIRSTGAPRSNDSSTGNGSRGIEKAASSTTRTVGSKTRAI